MREPRKPKFSIIVPTHNRPDECLRTVKAILDQTLDDLELLVINNGSSIENIARYNLLFSEIESQIRYIDLTNQYEYGFGPSRARNLGIRLALGEYIGFCDDDDEWIDERYLENVSKTISNQDVDIVFSNQQALDLQENLIKESWYDRVLVLDYCTYLSDNCYSVNIEFFYKFGGFPHLNCTIYNAGLLKSSGGFDVELNYEEDFELFHRLAKSSKSVIYHDEVISRHFIPDKQHKNNVSTSIDTYSKYLTRANIAQKLLLINQGDEFGYFCKKQASNAYKHLTEIAVSERKIGLARQNALCALAWEFSVKWLFRAVFLYIFRR